MAATSRYTLAGSRGAWDDFLLSYDSLSGVYEEAEKRLKDGYRVLLIDNKRGAQAELKLDENGRITNAGE